MEEVTKSFASKSQVDNVLNIADEKYGKNKRELTQTFDLNYFFGRSSKFENSRRVSRELLETIQSSFYS